MAWRSYLQTPPATPTFLAWRVPFVWLTFGIGIYRKIKNFARTSSGYFSVFADDV